jgi:hypothetical protein
VLGRSAKAALATSARFSVLLVIMASISVLEWVVRDVLPSKFAAGGKRIQSRVDPPCQRTLSLTSRTRSAVVEDMPRHHAIAPFVTPVAEEAACWRAYEWLHASTTGYKTV